MGERREDKEHLVRMIFFYFFLFYVDPSTDLRSTCPANSAHLVDELAGKVLPAASEAVAHRDQEKQAVRGIASLVQQGGDELEWITDAIAVTDEKASEVVPAQFAGR